MPRATSIIVFATLLLAGGALADGATLSVPGDFATIQGAIDAAESGDVIVVGKDVWAENLQISGKTNLMLVGKGKPILDPGGTGVGLAIIVSSDITVTGFTIRNTGSHGVHVSYSARVGIYKCLLTDIGNDGIRADGCDHVTIEKNTLDGIAEDGIALSNGLDLTKANDCLVLKNKIMSCGEDALDLNGNNNRILGNKASKIQEDGFEIDTDGSGTGNVFEKNSITDCEDDGFVVSGDGNRLTKNKATNTGFDGIYVAGNNNTVEGNKIKGPGDDGIDVEGTGNTFTGNKVSGADDFGFEVTSGSNTFTGNKASKSGTYDLSDTAGGRGNTYNGNKFRTEAR